MVSWLQPSLCTPARKHFSHDKKRRDCRDCGSFLQLHLVAATNTRAHTHSLSHTQTHALSTAASSGCHKHARTHTHSLSLSHTYLHRLDLRLRSMRRPFPIKEALLYQGSPPLSRRLCHLTRLKNCLRLRRPCRKSRGPSPAHFHNIYIYVYHFHYIYIYIYIASSVHTYICVWVCVYTYMYNAVSRALRIFIHGCM